MSIISLNFFHFQLRFTFRRNVVIASLILAVWSSPIRPVDDIMYGPVGFSAWLSDLYIPANYDGPIFGIIHSVIQPNLYYHKERYPQVYILPFYMQPQPPYMLKILSIEAVDYLNSYEAMNKKFDISRNSPVEDVIMSSLDFVPRGSFHSDKSLLLFIDQLGVPIKTVKTIMKFPNIRLTYKNITLTGIAVG